MNTDLPDNQPQALEILHMQDQAIAAARQRKRRIIGWIIVLCLLLIPVMVWLQTKVYQYEDSLPVSSDILIFSFININLLLVLLVLFLILRNIAELFFERRMNRSGSKLQTKLVASFLALTFFPILFLFFVALHFVSTSIDYWFSSSLDVSLQKSLELAQSIIGETKKDTCRINERLAEEIQGAEIKNYSAVEITEILGKALTFNSINGPDLIGLILEDDTTLNVQGKRLHDKELPSIPLDVVQRVKQKKEREVQVQSTPMGELVSCLGEVQLGQTTPRSMILLTALLIESEQMQRMNSISQGLESYRQLKHFKDPFKLWLIGILLLVTLLIIFAAIWFGLRISQGITRPLQKLVLATHRVANGDLAFVMEKEANDEIGLLVTSFNQMTHDLQAKNQQLAAAHAALQTSSQEAEQRRRYTEIILQSVSTGVISLDERNRITTFNRFAEKLLGIDKSYFLGHAFTDILPEAQARIIENFIEELNETGKNAVEQHLKITVRGKTYSLLISFIRLEDEQHTPLGYVLVFDDLTKLERMQRIAAWRDVARRIAHEIKNPLTPIQLSAQRLRKRYPEILADPNGIFDQCTHTIIRQVDELKNLVGEFSRFARMPKMHKTEGHLIALINDTLFMYREAHKAIRFGSVETESIPALAFDAEQIKRCLINLLDNAVAVLPDGGTIDVELSIDRENDAVLIKIADSGPGISREIKQKLFDPYFSTKKTGTGLGLAIVSTIMADHNGSVRVQDNVPHGAVFILELPLHQQLAGEESANV